jgi:hypothetical protein
MAGPVGYEVSGPNGERGWWDGKKITPLGQSGAPQKALNPKLQSSEDADIEQLQGANALSEMMGHYGRQIDQGELKLGPVKNVLATAQNALGMSNDQSRNYGSFRSGLEKLRNDSLRLNKGVQTEGDAQRAWNELFSSLNDQNLVRQRLDEIKQIDDRAVRYKSQSINQRRTAQGVDPLDMRPFTQGSLDKPFDLSGGQSRTTIPYGAYYKDPFGNIRRNDNGDSGNPKFDVKTGKQKMDAQPKGPSVGVVEDGYRFKGGNPSDPKSWERVQ